MGLLDFLKPKWKSGNSEVRLAAVRAMGTRDLGTLKAVAAGDGDPRVRLAAVERIGDRGVLEELIGGVLGAEVSQTVAAKIDRLLCEEALVGSLPVGIEAALGRLEDLALVERLAAQAPTPALRVMAVERIGDQEALCRIVETNCGKEPARVALAKIDEEPLLARIARTGASKVTRRLAEEKLAALAEERVKPVERERRERQLAGLADEAVGLASSEDWEASGRRLAALESAWQELDPDHAHPRWPSFDGATVRVRERRVEALRRREEAKREAELRAAGASEAGAEALAAVEALVGAQDEGADERFRQAQIRWASARAGADVSSLAARFDQACERYRAAREAFGEERRRLGELMEELDRLEGLRESRDLERARRALAELDGRSRRAGFQTVDLGPFQSRLEAAKRECEARLASRAEDEERARRDNLARRAELCAELEAAADAEDRAAAGRRVKTLRKAWRELPASTEEEAGALNERFAAAADRFAVRQAAFQEEQGWLRWNNKTLQEELCACVEALDAEEDLAAVADRMKEAQRRWKEIGPAPRAEADALWQRFKSACDLGFERCRPYFDELERRSAEGVERREELCRQAEAHIESTEWKESAEALKRLQAEWREAGPIPRARDRELYARFRRACDGFFERRQAQLAELDESRRGIQAEKERLCERAEALVAEPDRRHTREFRELQAVWKRLGPAPRDVERQLWERFRGSCDRFFAWLDAGRLENLRLKEALCEEVETLMAGVAEDTDPQEITGKIAELQKRWNEIGPVPRGEDDAIWERFHRPFDEFFEARRGQKDRETEAAPAASVEPEGGPGAT